MEFFKRQNIMTRDGKQLYLRRFILARTPWFCLYIHNFLLPDEDAHCHDHPWSFGGIILRGGYTEELYYPTLFTDEVMRQAGDVFFKRSGAFHRVAAVLPNTWTLVVTGPRHREWGFAVPSTNGYRWQPYYEYVERFRRAESTHAQTF